MAQRLFAAMARGASSLPSMSALFLGMSLSTGQVQAKNPPENLQWQTYNKSYEGQRYSPLRQIDRTNIATLKRVCEVEVGEQGAFQSGLLVIDDTLFMTTPHTTLAVNATTCEVRWRDVHVETAPYLNPGNRGPAYYEGKIFRGTGDGWLVAFDARTGRQLWKVAAGDTKLGEHFSSAPIAWKGKLYIGTSGGDWGAQARVAAYDVDDGR